MYLRICDKKKITQKAVQTWVNSKGIPICFVVVFRKILLFITRKEKTPTE